MKIYQKCIILDGVRSKEDLASTLKIYGIIKAK